MIRKVSYRLGDASIDSGDGYIGLSDKIKLPG